MTRILWSAFVAFVLCVAGVLGACGSSGGTSHFNPGGGNDGGSGLGSSSGFQSSSGGTSLGGDGGLGTQGVLVIAPLTPTVNVTLGTTPTIPTVQFTATYRGASVVANWSIDQGQLGTINASGVFTPGSLGGSANVTGTYQGMSASTAITVKVTYVGVGDPNPPDAGTGGVGGYGGVGGSGEGSGATGGQVTSLNGPPTADPALTFLYPYDKTVFPQALLPPLLQWTYGTHTFTAVYIHITEPNYEYKGYFQAPTAEAAAFQNHPVPQAAWDGLAYSSTAATPATVQLTFLDAQGAVWGPISETWIFAQGELKGTIYYNSYGTNLAHNYCCALNPATGTDTGGASFGGATLAIKEGATSPVLTAGNDTECRVCHSVAAGGSVLVTQQGESSGYDTTSSYALTAANAETTLANNNGDTRFEYSAVYPDGTLLFTHESALYDITGNAIAGVTGLPAGLSGYLPAFSPDGAHVGFNFAGGTGSDGASIASIDFAKGTNAFTNLQTLYTPTVAGTHAYWPSYMPTSNGMIFDIELVSDGRDTAGTRSQCDVPSAAQGGNGSDIQPTNACHSEGAHAELWWVDVASKTAVRLDTLNGKGYVPPHPSYGGTNGDDSTLNYEPTVNPVPSGGYAWVVFTSRRLYGNVATINPYWSDPRFEDISATPTTKKLWVAAIDLNAKPGTDPSHPAFYLPAQELLAGNSRGFWVVDPCHANGASCATGDECCGGYCQAGDDGGLQCTATKPVCAAQYEKCTTTADCCSATPVLQCINGLCSTVQPQ